MMIQKKEPNVKKSELIEKIKGDDLKYNCSCCNYSTEYSGNWSKHKKTKSHLKKSIQSDDKPVAALRSTNNQFGTTSTSIIKFFCPYCDADFGTKQSLSRHKNKRCPLNNTNDLKKQIEDLLKKNIELKDDKETFKTITKSLNDTNDALINSIHQ
jgi:DNA-directed RNA polymerase subunit M/transcription elongation factor TFIIS